MWMKIDEHTDLRKRHKIYDIGHNLRIQFVFLLSLSLYNRFYLEFLQQKSQQRFFDRIENDDMAI